MKPRDREELVSDIFCTLYCMRVGLNLIKWNNLSDDGLQELSALIRDISSKINEFTIRSLSKDSD